MPTMHIIYREQLTMKLNIFEGYISYNIIYFPNFLCGHLHWLQLFAVITVRTSVIIFFLLVQNECTLFLRLLIHIAKLFSGKIVSFYTLTIN